MAETLGPRRPVGKRRYFLLLPLLVAVALSAVLVIFSRPNSEHELDGDLCALGSDRSAGRAVFLLDFRKPMDDANLLLPGELVRKVSLLLGANTELRVFALSADPRAPRQRRPADRQGQGPEEHITGLRRPARAAFHLPARNGGALLPPPRRVEQARR